MLQKFNKALKACEESNASKEPLSPPKKVRGTHKTNIKIPERKEFLADILKSFNPAKIPICVVVIALKTTTTANAWKAIFNQGSFR